MRSQTPQITQSSSDRNPILARFSQHFWGRSTLLASLASVTIHGLIIILLPYISDFATTVNPTLAPPIQVVELTPSEQERIPTLAAKRISENSLPAVFYQPVLPIAPTPTEVDVFQVSSSLPNVSLTPSPIVPTPQPLSKENSTFSLYTKPVFPVSSFPAPIDVTTSLKPSPSTTTETPDLPSNLPQDPIPESTPTIELNSTKLSFNLINTSDEAGNTNYHNWAAKLDISSTKFHKFFVKGNYPKVACTKKLNGEVAVAVLIGTDRQPNNSEVVKSSGYQVFDEQAITDVISANFEEAIVGDPYIVMLKYQYNSTNCEATNQIDSQKPDP
jgi:TonB family protein